jgi:hypothetical protein
MHANDHRRRGAFARDSFNDSRGGAMPFAQTADFLAVDKPQQTGLAHRLNRGSRESPGGVYFWGRRRNDFFGNALDDLEPGRCRSHI